MIEVLAAFGLSGATGLNAYLPLLIVGALIVRFFVRRRRRRTPATP